MPDVEDTTFEYRDGASPQPEVPTAQPEVALEMDVEDALKLAVMFQSTDKLDEAEAVLNALLRVAPDHPDVLHFYGVLRFQRGDAAEGAALVTRALALVPDSADMWNNLGNIEIERGRPTEAIEAYAKAISLNGERPALMGNYGAALRALGRFDEAETVYLRALESMPNSAEILHNLGTLYYAMQRPKAAAECWVKVMDLRPGTQSIRVLRGFAHYAAGDIGKATEAFREWLDAEPTNVTAKHMYAACSGESVPDRASDDYITETFDRFSETFDAKLGRLDYKAPDYVAQALAEMAESASGSLHVLDAGCGTGLCGPLVKPWARHLTGVDLSSGMLSRAKGRAVYDRLYEAELTAFVAAHPVTYDVIISADTLCYFGVLDAVFAACTRALKPGGLLIFTVEEAHDSPAGFRINPHGRYSHEERYVRRELLAAGFDEPSIRRDALRMEGGLPVGGLIVGARKKS